MPRPGQCVDGNAVHLHSWLDAIWDKELTAFQELANHFASSRRKLSLAPQLTAEAPELLGAVAESE
jgi:hypothetical protein